MRPLALALLLAALVASGCANDSRPSATTPTVASDPGRDAMRALTAAVRAGDRQALTALVWKRCRRPAVITRLIRDVEPLTQGYRIVVSEKITAEFGVVAAARGSAAFAVPLHVTEGRWMVEPCGIVSIEISGPQPGARERVGQIGIELRGRHLTNALLWADGVTLSPRVFGGGRSATVFANFETALAPGRHVAVAYGDGGGYAAARAWTFVAR